MNFPERLETERLLLRRQQESDAAEMFARYTSDPEVTRYLSWGPHQSVDDTLAFLRLREAEQPGHTFNWLIYPKQGGLLLGSIGCRVMERHLVQFGYCLARDSWGNGYASEAAQAMVRVWFEDPSIWRVQAFCDLENLASVRVLEKAGLTREGTLRKYILTHNMSDVPCDVYCYARVREG